MIDLRTIGPDFSVKSVDASRRTFRGLSSTWDKDLGGDIVHKGAFSRTLAHWRQTGRMIALTDGHPEMESGPQSDRVLGKMIDAAETDDGLVSEFKMRDTQKATDALEGIQGGFITGLSITYKAIEAKREPGRLGETSTRHLHELKLHSVGLVTAGMNPGAHADPTSVKSLLEVLQQGGTLSDENRAAFAALPADLKSAIRALLVDPATPLPEAPVATPVGLAPDHPQRLAMSAQLRGLKLRSLTV